MAGSTMGVRLNKETQHRLEALEAERQLVKDRWQKYELTGETVGHADVKAWAASLGDTRADVS